jgi:acyl carrier protein
MPREPGPGTNFEEIPTAMTKPDSAPKAAPAGGMPALDPAAIELAVRELAAKHFKVDVSTITASTNFREQLRADSLDLVLLVHDVEDRFKVVISQDDMMKVQTLADAVAIVVRSPRG